MIRENELEAEVHQPAHINMVLSEICLGFAFYFEEFRQKPCQQLFQEEIERHQKEQEAYQKYLDLQVLEEYAFDPNAFKGFTKKNCPIIQRCLWSQDEIMKSYKIAFNNVSGQDLLEAVSMIAEFGRLYVNEFSDQQHEHADSPSDLGLETLNEPEYGTLGVIGYGVQSSFLYGLYPRCFAHRSQNAVWSLYFLSNRKEFGLQDGSEFLMIHQDQGRIEQNYFYPAQLFAYYALKTYLLLKEGCHDLGIGFNDDFRYIYLSVFNDFVAEKHREDILTYRRSSSDVESQPWF
jgi:hypothetical protein